MIILWNCRGCASNQFVSTCKSLIQINKPMILILLETWISGDDANSVIRCLSSLFFLKEEVVGFSRGIWILWSCPNISIVPIQQLGSSSIVGFNFLIFHAYEWLCMVVLSKS